MAALDIELIPAFADNYIYLLRDRESACVGVVDPGDAAPVERALAERNLTLTHIFNTHHHADHTGGNEALKARFACPVIGPRADQGRIPRIDIALGEGDEARFGGHGVRVLDTPGHTRGHIAFWLPTDGALFCGDTLFALGCGRLFEGTPAQMWTSLVKLRSLPADTRVYCGHEYTLANARFAVTIDRANADLRERAAEVEALRRQGRPTLPSTVGVERATNPFLRADRPEIAAAVGLPDAEPAQVFAEIRRRKDSA